MQKIQILSLFNKLKLNLISLGYKSLSTTSIIVTNIFIGLYLSAQDQGYYFAFLSIIGLQSIVEFGFGSVILNYVSHEWTLLKINSDGSVIGNQSNLKKLMKITVISKKIINIISIIFPIVIGIIGYYYFTYQKNIISIEWIIPWLILSACIYFNLILSSQLIILEGCGQRKSVYTIRFYQVFVSNVFGWMLIYIGIGIWVLPAIALLNIIITIYLIRSKFYNFIHQIIMVKSEKFDYELWRNEILPLQLKNTNKFIVILLLSYFILILINIIYV
jgi:hypothetical protein